MANAEQLLHEAQYAFQCISFGETRENKRNAARAKSLCLKIIRKYPASMETGEAHAILRRLGEEAYSSEINKQHQHISSRAHHTRPQTLAKPNANRDLRISSANSGDSESLNWGGLLTLVLTLPKGILALVAFAGFFLFGIFGPLIFVPLVLLVLFTGPFRQSLKEEQREQMNAFVARANEFINSKNKN